MNWTDDLLAALPDGARALVTERNLEKGQPLFHRGDAPQAMFCVMRGEVRMVRASASGAEIVFQRVRQGIVAEASLDQPAYHCDARAIVASRVLAIPRSAFREALAEARFRDFWIASISRELRRVRAHGERLGLRTARERILHFIETEGQDGCVMLSQTKKAWASELGLTHEALYRALKQMSRSGEIVLADRLIQLSDSSRPLLS